MRDVAKAVEWAPSERDAKATYRFLTTAVAPRPIAWVTSVNQAGVVNAAPFSWFNSVCPDPPMVMIAIGNRPDGSPKDTVRNIRDTHEFVVNAVPRSLVQVMVDSSADYHPDVSEVDSLGLQTAPSRTVRPPRLADSPIHLECRLERVLPIGRGGNHSLVLGEVVHIAVDDAVLGEKGLVDPTKLTLVGRWGGADYVDTSSRFTVPWPKDPGDPLRKP